MPEPADVTDGLTPELLDSCRESTRRVERMLDALAPADARPERVGQLDDLGWAIRAIDEAPSPLADPDH